MFRKLGTSLAAAAYRQSALGSSGCSTLSPISPTFRVLQNRAFASSTDDFEDAKKRLNSLAEDPGADVKLKLYGLFKQATSGKCDAPKPGMLDIVGKAKWNAWSSLGSMSKEEAQQDYINVVNSLVKTGGDAASSEVSVDPSGKYKEILYEEKGKLSFITLNRPQKMNSLTTSMYHEMTDALSTAGKNKACATVITGSGKYFSSGNDLSNASKLIGKEGNIKKMAEASAFMLEKFVSAFIDHPKLLVGLINGPAIGISCTTLGLYDVVYASDAAYFHTPFTNLGLTPEGCSSWTFPRRMGVMTANEVLLLGRKLSAAEAKEVGFITEVFPADIFTKETERRLDSFSKFAPISLRESKIMIRSFDKEDLHRVNHEECTKLIPMWQGEECLSAAAKFLSKK